MRSRRAKLKTDTLATPRTFRLELTEEQKAKVRAATGKEAGTIELNVERLEERIAPAKLRFTK